MDSYSSYRDSSARSPGDRGWSSRGDVRIKDERDGDSFYRSRSPGVDRPRRRSRSPAAAVDRYEPRGRGRDDYAGTRDRDDRPRRINSPPANIDRYVPGQSEPAPAAQPLANPIPDPIKLPYQVGFSYFGEWWRANEKIKEEKERQRTGRRREPDRVRGPREAQEEREKEKAKIQAAYDSYKEELQGKMAQTFVKQHKDEQWFRERYVPEIRDGFKRQLNDFRRGNYTQWEQDLESGTFDDFTLEGIPKSESNGAGGVVEKEEGEATAANEVLGVGDLVPASSAEIRDENLFQPTLLIKTIAPSVSRQNLENFCREHLGEEEGGFKWLSLSDPNPSKRYHRIGWIMLHPAAEAPAAAEPTDLKDEDDGELPLKSPAPVSTAEKALDAINGKTVKDEQRGDFTCHVGVHNPPSNPRKKALWDLFSAPERIEKDLELVRRLVNKFEEDFGSDFNATLKIEERVDDLKNSGRLQPAVSTAAPRKPKKERVAGIDMDVESEDHDGMEEGEEDEDEEEGAVDDEVDDEDILVKKKQLDLMIEYLRRVFNFCFFCVFESDSIHELTRKCPGGHLRRPRGTLSTSAKAVARASALGEPFPSKKRKEEELEEGEAPESGERKFRPSSKTEQQLQRAYNWVKTFEDKIMQILEPDTVDIRKLGGKPTEDAINEELSKNVKQEDEHKWRCRVPECTKLFKEEHFWKKHIEKRHTEWLEKLKEEIELINAYVIDPSHIAPSRTDANSNGHFPPANGQQPTGTPRGFNLQNYAMNSMLNFPGFPMPVFPPGMMGAGNNAMGAAAGWHAPGAGGDDRGGAGGPIRRGGAMGAGGGGRFQNRTGPYDRRQNPRWGSQGAMDPMTMMGPPIPGSRGGIGRPGGPANRWGDGAAGGAAMGPREAVQGRTIKSYEDLDQVSGGVGGELNY
ncbi:serrate RNA effector molecule [Diplogelasinospora grovesii]|uniref:Serrate RNA effector molecule n=1 Tax=Diplogelasinospora grovesii TaxID=303347 RepID=A0AAN6ND93_9PEZI|nr:serrate RNA effector molecule [Diplogelasinospora grovesii]